MPTRCRIGSFLTLLLAASLAQTLHAQTIRAPAGEKSPSHIPVPFNGPPDGRFEDFLKGRVDDAREHADASKMLGDILKNLDKQFSPDDLKAMKEKGILDENGRPPKLDDPKARDLLERWLQKQGGQRDQMPDGDGQSSGAVPDKRVIEFLEKLLKNTPEGGGLDLSNLPRPGDGGSVQGQTPPVNPQPPDLGTGRSVPVPPSGNLPQQTPPATKQEDFRDGLSKLVNKMRDSPLGESPTLRRIGRELSQPIIKRDDSGGEGESFLSKLPRLGDAIPFKRLFSGDNLPTFGKTNWSGPRMPSVGAPNVSGMQGPGEGTFIGVLWIVLGVVGVVLLWRFLATRRTAPVQVQQAAWRLGPWPVNPAAVATREDLIRAFEYLSLLLLGQSARAWNHLEIAEKLGGQESDAAAQRRYAASHLAAIYEQARYAPPEEALPDEQLSEARRDLCLLAGVAAA